jgi:hypothetical protein
LFRIIDAIF